MGLVEPGPRTGIGCPDGDRPHLTRREHVPIVVTHLDDEVGEGSPARSVARRLVPILDRGDGRDLGQSVGGVRSSAEPGLELGPGGGGEEGATGPHVGEGSEVLGCDLVGAGQALQQRGDTEPGVDLLGPDPLRHGGRVGAVHDDLRPAGLRDEQRARHLHVEDRQRGAVALAQLGSEPAGRHEDGAGKQDVAVRMEHALRPPRGAAGVCDGGQVRRVSPDPPIGARVSPEALPPLDFPGPARPRGPVGLLARASVPVHRRRLRPPASAAHPRHRGRSASRVAPGCG